MSSIAAVSSVAIPTLPQAALAPDGDSKTKEATESAALQTAEKSNGGLPPKAGASTSPVTSTAAGGVNKLL
jgi:hypothetical protein